MGSVMTAAVLARHGGPDALEIHHDWPVPPLGPGQVLVRVQAAAVNNTDIWTREGAYGLPGDSAARAGWRGPLSFPRVQGGDIAGVIEETGEGVQSEMSGRRVLIDPAIYRDADRHAPPIGLLGSEVDGGFATYVVVDAAQAHDVTESPLSDEQLACLPIAYGTAMGMLERAAIGPGETVLVTGASGGVGLALVQLASARKATVLAVTLDSKAKAVQQAGATTIIRRDVGSLTEQVKTAAPEGLDAVADIVGGAGIGALMPLLRDDGRWVIAGALAGAVVPFDIRRLYLHNLRFIGSSMHTREHFTAIVRLARDGSVSPLVAERHHLVDIHAAQDQFVKGDYVGKITITP